MGGHVMSVPLYQAKAEFFKTLGHPGPDPDPRAAVRARPRGARAAGRRSPSSRATSPSSSPCCGARRWWCRTAQGGEVVYSVSVPGGARPAAGGPPHPVAGSSPRRATLEAELTPDRRPVSARRPPGRRPRAACGGARGPRAAAPRRRDWTRTSAPAGTSTAGVMVGPGRAAARARASASARAWAPGPGWSRRSSPAPLAAVFGGSRVQVSGPTGAMTVVLVPIIATYGAHGVLVVGLLAGADPDRARVRRRRPLHPLRAGPGRRGLHRRHRRDHRAAAGAGRARRRRPRRRRWWCWPADAVANLGCATRSGPRPAWPWPWSRLILVARARRGPGWPGSLGRRGRGDGRELVRSSLGRRHDRSHPVGLPAPSLPPVAARPSSTPCCCPPSRSPRWRRWRACSRRRWPTR